ncbi:hypothetical protein B296_00037261 [Ensete ventricosum]|uniref:Uncharacterized protein n=1 Tax=Ensete ventricosum TaxID=4639 RepID=A0A426ZXF0_ENSVE|nr:hypothetical protein B296_00037261 [Ensete ventricosum]
MRRTEPHTSRTYKRARSRREGYEGASVRETGEAHEALSITVDYVFHITAPLLERRRDITGEIIRWSHRITSVNPSSTGSLRFRFVDKQWEKESLSAEDRPSTLESNGRDKYE